MAIEDQVTATIPETLAILEDKTDWADDTVDAKVAAVLSETFPDLAPPVNEDSLRLTDFQQRYLGDAATLLVCDAAIDYFASRTGRQDSIQGVPAGQSAVSQRTSGPGTGRQNYDRVQALKDLGTRIIARLASDAERFKASFSQPSPASGQMYGAGLMISTFGIHPRTVDPARVMRINPFPWESLGPAGVWGGFAPFLGTGDDLWSDDVDATNL